MVQAVGVVTLVIIAVFLIIVGPFITIWALNTLFPMLAIPYTFYTWLAVLCLGGLFNRNQAWQAKTNK